MDSIPFNPSDFSRSFSHIQSEIDKIIQKSDAKVHEWLNKKELIIQLATEIVDDLETQDDFRSYVYWLYYQLQSDIFVSDILNSHRIQVCCENTFDWTIFTPKIVWQVVMALDIEDKNLQDFVRQNLGKPSEIRKIRPSDRRRKLIEEEQKEFALIQNYKFQYAKIS